MHETVAIVGGGVAGLTAAHELMERGFDVHVYERRELFGGKAASVRISKPSSGNNGDSSHAPASLNGASVAQDHGAPNGAPGEHGFRFFPGWYRHLIDTMARIPYHKTGGGRRTVADNLVSVQANQLAWFDRPPLTIPLHLPDALANTTILSDFLQGLGRLGLTASEVALFVRKLTEFAMLSDERREEEFEAVSWWTYLECDEPGRSRAYQDLVRATTQTSVAARAEEASAFSVGRVALRTILESLSSVDRVLNGPTAEVWIDPWIEHLKARGVSFHPEMELDAIEFDGTGRKVKRLLMEPTALANARRLRNQIERLSRHREEVARRRPSNPPTAAELQRQNKDQSELQKLEEDARKLFDSLKSSTWLREHQNDADGDGKELDATFSNNEQLTNALASDSTSLPSTLLFSTLRRLETNLKLRGPVEAKYYVLALPLEQLAYHVNRTAMLKFLAPELRNTIPLSRHMDWMAGIQFYLKRPLDITPGHLIGLDSTWALTAIEQTQFWKDITLPPDVKAILSVDISAWNRRGRITRKEAFNCTPDEIATEVWAQLKEMLNKLDLVDVLRDDLLIGGSLARNVSYYLDDNIVDRRDRKKQAFYERARGVRFNTLELIGQSDDDNGGTFEDGYMWGPQRLFNAEPLLINRAGSRKLRPDARTAIPNLFLAGDFIKTETDIACMEGANEAARLAVNGILDAAGSSKARCEIWSFSPSRQAIEALMSAAGALRAVRGVATAVAQLQDQFFKRVAGGLIHLQTRLPAPRTQPDYEAPLFKR